ncbi:acetyltransferase [Photobacterium phosphoreum]|uniref:acetyltransferase n=1 Tax=Photobacterium phosphoreum TaxID=659 RepID=UPI000D17868A|nr:acetyltransferase [Photobacterium phosphoreum]PSU74918.1 acetyltransferase [Photobacterium phosphoreum]
MKGYDLLTIINLSLSFIYTKVFFKNCRIIRLPIVIRNKSQIVFGDRFVTGKYCRIDAFSQKNKKIINIGKNCQINDSVHIAALNNITIGDNVLIASRVFMTDHNHGIYTGDNQSDPKSVVGNRDLSSKPIIIKDNVWIGENVTILPGSIIGKNTIVGSNSVVSGVLIDNAIYIGVPAKIFKKYDPIEKKWVRV